MGDHESLTAADFVAWVTDWRRFDQKVVWRDLRPLIFVNACHSLGISAESLVTYLDAFIGTGRAAGVVGTEVKIEQRLAMLFAERFFGLLLPQAGSTVASTLDQALREVRLSFLREGNLVGLVYAAHGWADLAIEVAPSALADR